MKLTRFIMRLLVGGMMLTAGCAVTSKQKAVEHYATALALEAGDFEQDAIIQLKEAVRYDDELTLAYSKLGALYEKRGQYEHAATAFERACDLDPWAFDDHLNLGKVYRQLQRFHRAIQVLRRACQLNPQSAEANYNLGVCYYETEEFDLAAAFCHRAAELNPKSEQVMGTLGEIYGKMGDDYRAIQSYKQALEVAPDDYDVMIRLGMVYLHMERFRPAQYILEKACEVASERPQPYLALGYCFLCMQNIDDAMEAYAEALALDGDSFAAYNGIGVTKMMRYLDEPTIYSADAREALECWHSSLEINPDQPKIKQLIIKYRYLRDVSGAEGAVELPMVEDGAVSGDEVSEEGKAEIVSAESVSEEGNEEMVSVESVEGGVSMDVQSGEGDVAVEAAEQDTE